MAGNIGNLQSQLSSSASQRADTSKLKDTLALRRTLATPTLPLASAVKKLSDTQKAVLTDQPKEFAALANRVAKVRGLSPAACKIAAKELLRQNPAENSFEAQFAQALLALSRHSIQNPKTARVEIMEKKLVVSTKFEQFLKKDLREVPISEFLPLVRDVVNEIKTMTADDPQIEAQLLDKIAGFFLNPNSRFFYHNLRIAGNELGPVLDASPLKKVSAFFELGRIFGDYTLREAERDSELSKLDVDPDVRASFKPVFKRIADKLMPDMLRSWYLSDIEIWLKICNDFDYEAEDHKANYMRQKDMLKDKTYTLSEIKERFLNTKDTSEMQLRLRHIVKFYTQQSQCNDQKDAIDWTLAMLNFYDQTWQYSRALLGDMSPIPFLDDIKLFEDLGTRERLTMSDIGIVGGADSASKKVTVTENTYNTLVTLFLYRKSDSVPYVKNADGSIVIFINRHIENGRYGRLVKDQRGQGGFKRVRDAIVVYPDGRSELKAVGKMRINSFGQLKIVYFEEKMLETVPDHPNVLRAENIFHYDGKNKDIMAILPMAGPPKNVFVGQLISNFLGVAKGLLHLHQNGVVHNDFKLDNIIKREDTDEFAVIDFGLSVNYHLGLSLKQRCRDGTYPSKEAAEVLDSPSKDEPLSDIPLPELAKTDVWGFGLALLSSLGELGKLSPNTSQTPEETDKLTKLKKKFFNVFWDPRYAHKRNDVLEGRITAAEFVTDIDDFVQAATEIMKIKLRSSSNTPREHAIGNLIAKCLADIHERPSMDSVVKRMDEISKMTGRPDEADLSYIGVWAEIDTQYDDLPVVDMAQDIENNLLSPEDYQQLIDAANNGGLDISDILYLYECSQKEYSYITQEEKTEEFEAALLRSLELSSQKCTSDDLRMDLTCQELQSPQDASFYKRMRTVILKVIEGRGD